jgi:hypothetical protein
MSEATHTVTPHSPLPWEVHADLIWSPEGRAVIAAMCEPRGSKFVSYAQLQVTSPDFEEAYANRNLIVTAVNNHARLVAENAALRKGATAAIHALEGYKCGNVANDLADEVIEYLRAALSSEKGQQ